MVCLMLIGPIEIDKKIFIYILIHLSDLTEPKMSTSRTTCDFTKLQMFVTKRINYIIFWGS